MKNIVEVNEMTKYYGGFKALSNISFSVKEGEVLCILGPNGAGKSTLIHILSTILKPDNGDFLFEGKSSKKYGRYIKSNIGIVPQDIAIYEDISAEKNVTFFASLYGLKGLELQRAVTDALQFVALLDKKNEKPKTFSGGMKRRLNIACAIAHKPKVIIMDEPTVGIDPQSRNHILQAIKQLSERGNTVLYTTHYMEEVEEIATEIIIIDHGVIIAKGSKEEIKRSIENDMRYTIICDGMIQGIEERLFVIEGVTSVEVKENVLQIKVIKGIENLDKLISFLMNKGIKIKNITSEVASLETVFLQLTGRNLRD
ncbi:ABC transporter ATP-binding protein [Bacillus cereus]|uniref:ABC transporter ATP-binding protein n=1 Tax=Bacillus cereus TaxID=1396 RepID=UPI0038796213|nr:ABC transporter ATP-binding protein [Bacillus cereus]